MKSYSVTEVTHLDSTSLGAMIENHINYTVDTIILVQAELIRRAEFLDNHKNALIIFCSENNIIDLDSELRRVLEKNEIAPNEWKQLGRNNINKNSDPNIFHLKENLTKELSSKSNLDEESREEITSKTNSISDSNWKEARIGIIIFCVLHFIFETATGNTKLIGPMILFNYFISAAYIQSQIKKNVEKTNFLQYGLIVSGIVFLIRLTLGFIVGYFLFNQ